MFPFMLRQLAANRHFGNILATYFMDNDEAADMRQKARLSRWAFRLAERIARQRGVGGSGARAALPRLRRRCNDHAATERFWRRFADCKVTGARVSVG